MAELARAVSLALSRRGRGRWLETIALILAVFWLAPQLVVVPALAAIVLHPPRRPLPPDAAARALQVLPSRTQLEPVSINAADGATLRAWLLTPAEPRRAPVILLHGMGDNRLGMLGHASYLLADGHPVLLPDGRAQGESGGAAVTYGVLETDDMRRWAKLVQERQPGCVDALGESLGAAVVLEAISAFCAVVAEAPFASFREIATDRVGQALGLGPWFGRTVLGVGLEATILFIRFRDGIDLNAASPLAAIRGTTVPVLLIHGGADDNIPRRHCLALQAADPGLRLMDVPGAGHTAGLATAGQAFADWVDDYFDLATPLATHRE